MDASSSNANDGKMKETQGRVLLVRDCGFPPSHQINYGLGIVATVASKKYDVKIIDNNSRYVFRSSEDIVSEIEAFKPDVVGFSIFSSNACSSYKTIALIRKKFLRLPIIAGGHHVFHECREALAHGIDYVVRGEAEMILVSLIDFIIASKDKRGGKPAIQGVSYLNGGEFVDGGVAEYVKDLDSFSIVNYSLYDLTEFIRRQEDAQILGGILAQRGCPFLCAFCSDDYMRTKIRYRSIENTIQDVKQTYETYGVTEFTINDTNFMLSRPRVDEFCRAIIDQGLSTKLTFRANTNSYTIIDPEMLQLMRKAGFSHLSFGIERMEPEAQKLIRKVMDRKTIIANMTAAKKAGFHIMVNLLLGFPFDTCEALEKEKANFKHLLDIGVDMVSVCLLLPMPGTALYIEGGEKMRGWYLNPVLMRRYQPLYQMVRGLWYDYDMVDVFSFDRKFKKQMLATRGYFRAENVRQHGIWMYWLYKVAVGFSIISEGLYRISPVWEHRLMGGVMSRMFDLQEMIHQKQYAHSVKKIFAVMGKA